MPLIAASKSISMAEDVMDYTKLLMQLYAYWEQLLVPIPTSIGILGELVFISSAKDFAINKNIPIGGYKFIRYPDSFRACLMQVVNAGWQAFSDAHKNMDQIRLHSSNIGNYVVKQTVEMLMQMDDQLIATMLPTDLGNIKTIARTCTKIAEETENKFTFAIEMIHELWDACVNAQRAYGKLKEVTEKAIKVHNMKKTLYRAQGEMTKTLIELQNCNIDNIDFTQTLDSLLNGMLALSRLQEAWVKIICFFQMISKIIEMSLKTSLHDFIDVAEDTNKMVTYSAKQFIKDMLYQATFQSSNIASLVNMIAGTYVEVSDRFVMAQISSLGKIMGLDSNLSDFDMERIKLFEGVRDAEEGIKLLVVRENEEFKENASARLAKIESQLQAVLPPATENENQKIKSIVESGMRDLTPEEED